MEKAHPTRWAFFMAQQEDPGCRPWEESCGKPPIIQSNRLHKIPFPPVEPPFSSYTQPACVFS